VCFVGILEPSYHDLRQLSHLYKVLYAADEAVEVVAKVEAWATTYNTYLVGGYVVRAL
jgi:hypothetical protein